MTKKTILCSWKPQQLNQLFQIGSDTDIPQSPDLQAEYLDRILSGSLSLDKKTSDCLPGTIRPYWDTTGFIIEEPLITFLLNPVTNPDLLRQIKNIAKQTMSVAVSSAHRQAAAVVYHAAIASALLLFGQRISTLSYHQMAYTFARLKEKKWILPELQILFEKAGAVAKEREKNRTP